MRRLNHLTPTYIVNRSLVVLDEYLHPGNPWLTRDAVVLLDSLLRKSDVGLEFGSGRSTKWFLERMDALTSVEENEGWYRRVERETRSFIDSGKLHYKLATDEHEFVDVIDSFANASLDLCVVDSLYRDVCALKCVPKIKKGGILVVDNINLFIPCDSSRSPDSRRSKDGAASERWMAFQKKTRDWRYIWTSNGVSDTGIWINAE